MENNGDFRPIWMIPSVFSVSSGLKPPIRTGLNRAWGSFDLFEQTWQ